MVQLNAQILTTLNLQQQRLESVISLGIQQKYRIATLCRTFPTSMGKKNIIRHIMATTITALLYHLPDASTFQIPKAHLVGAAKFWFNSRAAAVTNFSEFKQAFSNTE